MIIIGKRIIFLMMCMVLVLSAPATAKAASTTEYVQVKEKMKTTGYTQKKIKFKALPATSSKTLGKIKVNTEIKYRKYNKKWLITVYKGQIGFVQKKHVKTAKYTPSYFKRMGIIEYNGWRWTWYSQRVLPGGGLRIPGRHVDARTGFICDKNGYICLASNNIPYGSTVDTPFGRKGKIYDSGCNGVDTYVDWN